MPGGDTFTENDQRGGQTKVVKYLTCTCFLAPVPFVSLPSHGISK